MSIGDDRPRILDEDDAAILEQYGIDEAIDKVRQRWFETDVAQKGASLLDPQLLALHPIILELRARFEADVVAAQARPMAIESLQRARERLQLVSGEHAPLDNEVHAEYRALAPVLESIECAIAAMQSHETQLAKHGRLPWYRRRVGGRGYRKKTAGSDHPKWGWVPGDADTTMATRSDEIWFSRAGADPIVALKIAQSVMKAVQPPPVKKNRGQFEDEQINRVLILMKGDEVNLPTTQISQMLVALGYESKKVSRAALDRRLSDLRTRGHVQPVAKSVRGRVLGRRRTRTKRRSTVVRRARIS
jgi:hypothetical protein